MQISKLYNELLKRYKETKILSNINNILFWDREVSMPLKGDIQRADEMALIEKIIHQRNINPRQGELLKQITNHVDFQDLSSIERRNIELIQREFKKNVNYPIDLAEELSKQSSQATKKWKEAKKKGDFSIFHNSLARMIELKKKEAQVLNPALDPYDVLLEQYEFGFNSSIYDALFEETKKGLIPLIEKCIASSKQPDESILQRKCALDLQRKVIMDVVQYFGYSSERGRIDESVHAFTSGYLNDVRITVDYDEKNIVTSYTAALHELGHALYVQNISPKFKFQPVGSYCSAAMDEGQARFLENTIGRDLSFWQFYFTKFKKLTSNTYDDVNLESFVLALNKVAPSPIRVTADPLTYPLHIILRYELEKKLFAEKITVDEIPTYWNESMEQYLGVEITDDSEGVLQDVHFAWGLFGYFPTYALGSFYNAQFISKLSGDIPDWKNQISKGNFFPVIEWLNTNIRVHGNFYDPLILIKEVTGNEFSANYFIKEAKEKYSELYEL